MIKKIIFFSFILFLSLSPLAQTQQLQNHLDTLEQLSSHDRDTLNDVAQQITKNLSDQQLEKSHVLFSGFEIVVAATVILGVASCILCPAKYSRLVDYLFLEKKKDG